MIIARLPLCLVGIVVGSLSCAGHQPPPEVSPPANQPLRVVALSRRSDSTMMWIARLWSESEGPAACGRTPPPKEVIWFPNGRYCQLSSAARGQIGFRLDAAGFARMVTWNRITDSRAHAQSVSDSLDVVFRERAITGRLCRPASPNPGDLPGMLWEAEGIVVHLSWITAGDERPKLLAIAVDDPKEFPFFLCKAFDQARSADSRRFRNVTE